MDEIILDYIVEKLEESGIPFVQSVQTTYVPFSIQSIPNRHVFVQNDQKPVGSFLFYEDRLRFICSVNGTDLEQLFYMDVYYETCQFDMELIKREALVMLLSIWI